MISAYIPNDDDTKLSLVSSRILAAHIHNRARKLRFFEEDGSEQDVEIPAAAYQMLVDALTLMSQGNGRKPHTHSSRTNHPRTRSSRHAQRLSPLCD